MIRTCTAKVHIITGGTPEDSCWGCAARTLFQTKDSHFSFTNVITNVITMCAMLQINDVIKGTDETTETIMKSNAGKSKIFNDFVTSHKDSTNNVISRSRCKKKSKFFVILIIITLSYQSDS